MRKEAADEQIARAIRRKLLMKKLEQRRITKSKEQQNDLLQELTNTAQEQEIYEVKTTI